jgi:fused signal recognition particle receptor
MFSFFRKKPADVPAPVPAPVATGEAAPAPSPASALPAPKPGQAAVGFLKRVFVPGAATSNGPESEFAPLSGQTQAPRPAMPAPVPPAATPPAGSVAPMAASPAVPASPVAAVAPPQDVSAAPPAATSTTNLGWMPSWARPADAPAPPAEAPRAAWFQRLRSGLARTGNSIAQVFTGTRIDELLYEELESALLMADAGVRATEHLLRDLRSRVKAEKATHPVAVKALLADAVVDLLQPLQRPLEVGRHVPTVIMVAGVNGAGKTTSIGKLTRHLADHGCKVLLAAADTFRAAAREQLEVWADRNQVEIVSQAGGDPASVVFDAVNAGRARGCDVVIADTAGRLPTQLHLMEELKKIRRVINKADATAPHEVLLVVDGNTGQNALEQVKAFDAAIGLTGLIVTKLDGTAKGGVLAAIALWSRERARDNGTPSIPVYFIGMGEKLEDLQTFDAREFAQALLD